MSVCFLSIVTSNTDVVSFYFQIDINDSQLMIISIQLWNREGSSFTPVTMHNQIIVSFQCGTNSSNGEGFAIFLLLSDYDTNSSSVDTTSALF